MSAVVRVKRRIDEEPLSAFIINCKRPKLNHTVPDTLLASKDEIATVVKFAATLESPDEEATLQIAKLTKDEAKELATKVHKYPNSLDRSRQQMRDKLHENRFKVVNCYRAIGNIEDDASSSKEITIVDVEKQPADTDANSSRQPATTQSSSRTPSTSIASGTATTIGRDLSDNYVYDLYLADDNEQQQHIEDTNLADNHFSVHPFDNLIYEDCNRLDTDDDDSEDSNQENYFKNDYPDTEEEDDENSISTGAMRKILGNLNFDDNLSSDDDEEHYRNGFIYSIDSEAIGFEDDIDYCDVNRYGETYARYRGRSRRNREAVYNDNESDCSDYHKESDDE